MFYWNTSSSSLASYLVKQVIKRRYCSDVNLILTSSFITRSKRCKDVVIKSLIVRGSRKKNTILLDFWNFECLHSLTNWKVMKKLQWLSQHFMPTFNKTRGDLANELIFSMWVSLTTSVTNRFNFMYKSRILKEKKNIFIDAF